MSNNAKTVTLKGYYQLFEKLFQEDERVRSFELGDVFDKDEGDLDYTTVILQPIDIKPIIGNGQIIMNEYRISLLCLGLRLKDKSNTKDVLSETANILVDTLTRLLQADEYFNLQIDINDNSVQLESLYVKGNDLALGHSMTLSFQAPYLLDNCDFDFDALSSDSGGVCEASLVQNSDGSYSVTIPSGGSYELPNITWVNSLSEDLSSYLPVIYQPSMVASDITITNTLTTQSYSVPLSGSIGVSFSGEDVNYRVLNTVFTELSDEDVPAGTSDFYVVQDSEVRLYSNPANEYVVQSIFVPAEASQILKIPYFDIVNQDGQTATSVSYSGTVHTDFSVATQTAEIYYQRPSQIGQQASYADGDSQWHIENGSYTYTGATGSTFIIPQLDYASTESDIRATYYGDSADGTDSIAPTRLVKKNAFGNKYRFTDDQGNPSDGTDNDEWRHVDFKGHSFTGAENNYIIDHITGLGYYIDEIADGAIVHLNTSYAEGQSWGDWVDFIHNDLGTLAGYDDFRMVSMAEVDNTFFAANSLGQQWGYFFLKNTHSSDVDLYVMSSDSYSSTFLYGVLRRNTRGKNIVLTKNYTGGSGYINIRAYAVRNHY